MTHYIHSTLHRSAEQIGFEAKAVLVSSGGSGWKVQGPQRRLRCRWKQRISWVRYYRDFVFCIWYSVCCGFTCNSVV